MVFRYQYVLFTIVFLLCSSSEIAAQSSDNLVWKGCGITRKAFMSEAAKVFKEKYGTDIKITGGGATLGIRTAITGNSDIGGTCRPTLPGVFPHEETGGYLTHVAWDAIVFITHPSNPVTDLTKEQTKDIFLGEITNWSEVGGPDERIVLIYRVQTEKGNYSGVGYMLRKLLFGNTGTMFTEKALYFRDSGLVEGNVERGPWSFAATGISSAKKRKISILSLNGVAPTKENIASGEYPFFRPLFLITQNKPHGKYAQFLDWILTDEGQAVISEQGTVNLEEGKILKDKYQHWENQEIILNFQNI